MRKKNIHIVTVVNNFDIFNKAFKKNKFIKDFDLTIFDNTKENIGISERYNSFINENIKPDSDYWVIFCHQDFGFLGDPLPILNKLDKNFIYGPYGMKLLKGLFIKHSKLSIFRTISVAQWEQWDNNFEFIQKSCKRIKKPTTVETLDCFCVILHSSLINEYDLKFDENLKFHMYVEELCINAKKNFRIKTKAVQLECFHIGVTVGTKGLNQEFYKSADYVMQKHNLKTIICTTPLKPI